VCDFQALAARVNSRPFKTERVPHQSDDGPSPSFFTTIKVLPDGSAIRHPWRSDRDARRILVCKGCVVSVCSVFRILSRCGNFKL
jgi:hypothetical protein